jgi:hypothetical protein
MLTELHALSEKCKEILACRKIHVVQHALGLVEEQTQTVKAIAKDCQLRSSEPKKQPKAIKVKSMITTLCKNSKTDKASTEIVKDQLLTYFKQQAKYRKFYSLQL